MRVLNHGRVRFRVCVSDETTRQEKEFPLGVVCPPPHPQPFFVCSVRVMHWVELGLYTGGKHKPQVISFHLALSLGLTQHAHTVHKCIYIQIKSITFSLTST